MKSINKEVVLIIGSSGLIGKNLLKYYHDKYILITTDIKPNKFSKKNLNKYNEIFIQSDITKESSIRKLILKINSKKLKINTVINCSYPKTPNWGKSFIDSSEKDLKLNISYQLSSSIMILRNFYYYFKKNGGGNVILVSSIQGVSSPKFDHYSDTSLTSPIEYTAVKTATISLVKYMAKFSKNNNIRFNCISPGGILNDQPKRFLQKYKNDCINKGMLSSNDLFSAFDFLISNKSKYVNGQNIIVDDGWSL